MDQIQVSSYAYNIIELNLEIKRLIKSKGDNEEGITKRLNYDTLKSRIILAHSYQNNFKIMNGLRYIGIRCKALGRDGVYDSERQDKATSPIFT